MTPLGDGRDCSLLMRKETAKKRLGARDLTHFPRSEAALPLILPVISRPLMRVRPRLFSTSRASPPRVSARTEPRLASPEYSLLSTHTHIYTYTPALPLFFFIYIYIYTHTIRRKGEERGERTRTFAGGASERRAHARRVGRSEMERGGSRRAAARNISTILPPSYHRRIQKCRREFCIMHGPRSAELPA